MRILLIFTFFVSFKVFSFQFIACNGGVIKVGDSFNKYKKLCDNRKNFSAGVKVISKKNILIEYKTFIKHFPDGSSLRLLFIDDKLAFIF